MSGKLVRVEGGLNELTFNTLSRQVCNEIEHILNIKSAYAIGLTQTGEILGDAVILTDKLKITNSEVIERFIQASAIALKNSEERRAKSEKGEFLHISMNSLAEAVITTNKTGYIEHLNPAAEELCGWKNENARGRHFKDIFNAFDLNTEYPLENALESLISNKNNGLNLNNKLKLVSKNGREYPINFNASLLSNDKGETLGVVVSFRRQEEVKINGFEDDKYKKLIGEIPIAVISSDVHGNIEFVNEQMLQMLGSPSESDTKSINLFTYEPLVKSGISAKIKECIESGNTIHFEHNYTSKWHKSIYFYAHLIPVREKEGNITNVLITAQDQTVRKIQENELKEAKYKAEEADKLKTAFSCKHVA